MERKGEVVELGTAVNQEAIDLLEDALERVERGEVLDIVILMVGNGDNAWRSTSIEGAGARLKMTGLLSLTQDDINDSFKEW